MVQILGVTEDNVLEFHLIKGQKLMELGAIGSHLELVHEVVEGVFKKVFVNVTIQCKLFYT